MVTKKRGKINPLDMAMRQIETATAHLPRLDRRASETIRHAREDIIVIFPKKGKW